MGKYYHSVDSFPDCKIWKCFFLLCNALLPISLSKFFGLYTVFAWLVSLLMFDRKENLIQCLLSVHIFVDKLKNLLLLSCNVVSQRAWVHYSKRHQSIGTYRILPFLVPFAAVSVIVDKHFNDCYFEAVKEAAISRDRHYFPRRLS